MATINLTLPQSGTVITAGLHSSNYGAIQTVVNGGLDNNNFASGLIFDTQKLMQNGATTGQALQWNGSKWAPAPSPGYEFDYTEVSTVAATNITATTSGTAQSIVTGASVTYDGSTTVNIEAFVGDAQPDTGVAGRRITVAIFDNGSLYRQFAIPSCQVAGIAQIVTCYGKWKITPTAAAHQYSIRSWVTAGTGVIGTGTGGSGDTPAWLRVTKA
jgi:hypothetical protein